jgi:hypothetical protein
VDGKTTVTEAEIARAIRLQVRILRLLGEWQENQQRVNAVSELRTRAFTRFMQAWDDVRCVVAHLRWKQGDADDFAPLLYTGRGNTKRKGIEPPIEALTAPNGATPGSGTAPNTPNAPRPLERARRKRPRPA